MAVLVIKFGDKVSSHLHFGEDCYTLVAFNNNEAVGIISTYPKNFSDPLSECKDAYIDIIEVDTQYQRQGIASHMIMLTEKWAKEYGYFQIRSWSSDNKLEAIPMWIALGYSMCPAKIWIEWCQKIVDGFYVVKQLNSPNIYPNITKFIKQDIYGSNGSYVHNLRLLRAKDGVYVYNGTYNGVPAIVKYFENDDDKREIKNYRILNANEIPTIKVFAFGQSTVVMENINLSSDWRLGISDDLQDEEVASSLAKWYFDFHEKGSVVPELHTLYCEYNNVTETVIKELMDKLPEAADTFQYILERYDKLRELIAALPYTLTYNDFYWTNFIVRKDKKAALMFDYNLLGKGCRCSDIRNVCSSLSENAATVFVDEYNSLYSERYNADRIDGSRIEEQVDRVVSCLFTLSQAIKCANFPSWAEGEKRDSLNGALLCNSRELLE